MLPRPLNMESIIPTKDSVIQGTTAAAKLFAAVGGLSAYAGYIPAKFIPVAFIVFTVASAFKEICTSILAVSRGDKITLAPPAPAQPVSK